MACDVILKSKYNVLSGFKAKVEVSVVQGMKAVRTKSISWSTLKGQDPHLRHVSHSVHRISAPRLRRPANDEPKSLRIPRAPPYDYSPLFVNPNATMSTKHQPLSGGRSRLIQNMIPLHIWWRSAQRHSMALINQSKFGRRLKIGTFTDPDRCAGSERLNHGSNSGLSEKDAVTHWQRTVKVGEATDRVSHHIFLVTEQKLCFMQNSRSNSNSRTMTQSNACGKREGPSISFCAVSFSCDSLWRIFDHWLFEIARLSGTKRVFRRAFMRKDRHRRTV
jgi:hypothetical protein